mmetsp:Transcript_3957/g.9665  ORF Transcript_3957/g.9665 Transcript_3957/m.9665 type:complete len:102 (-) Transcript_3957:798-1103(-)
MSSSKSKLESSSPPSPIEIAGIGGMLSAANPEFDLDLGGVRDRDRESEKGLLLPTIPDFDLLCGGDDGGGVLGEAVAGRSDAADVAVNDLPVGDLVGVTIG